MFKLLSLVSAGLLSFAAGQIPCDDQFGSFCPEASGWNVGDCLKGHQDELPEQCVAYISVMDSCRTSIDEHCTGKEYSGEAISCLSEWTDPEKLPLECKDALRAARPKPAAPKQQSEEDKRKADMRRRTRRAAAKKAGKDF